MGCPKAELSLLITDDQEIHELNKQWRGKDKPTDILSFSQLTARVKDLQELGPAPLLGDIVISYDMVKRQATFYRCSLDEEIDRLLVHGVLHLLGHDHVNGGHQARIMKDAEKTLIRKLRRTHKLLCK
ncbi:MAG: rRNA maturation RNase YbeY [Deltaproteobacteria bacterium]|nr:rRNA maturation RNase YbeY [Deltaproteobacteria bacterium]